MSLLESFIYWNTCSRVCPASSGATAKLGDIELLSGQAEAVLVIDEVQKVRNWSRMIKREWDALNYRPLFCFDDVLCGLLCRQVVEI